MNKEECCVKCRDYLANQNWSGCMDENCPCHHTSTSKWEEEFVEWDGVLQFRKDGKIRRATVNDVRSLLSHQKKEIIKEIREKVEMHPKRKWRVPEYGGQMYDVIQVDEVLSILSSLQ